MSTRISRHQVVRALAAAFPLALLLFATLFLRGRTGFWTDDYWLNRRDPVTGACPPLAELAIDRGFFLRPLFYRLMPPLITWCWDAPWAAHALAAAAHAGAVLLLWRLMLALGARRPAAAGAALLFMVYPAPFEAFMWMAALPTVLSSVLMLGVLLGAAWMAPRRADGAWWALGLVVMPCTVFAACCLNEQPAMGLAALPLVFVGWRGDGVSARRAFQRSLVPLAAMALAAALYVVLVIADPGRPVGARGSLGQVVTIGDAPGRVVHFMDVLWRRLVLKNFGLGAIREGWSQVRHAGAAGWAAVVLLTGSGALWCRGMAGRAEADGARPTGLLMAVGAVVFIAGWVPIAALAMYDPDSRTRYWPCMGLAMLFAGWLSRMRVLPAMRTAAAGLLLVVLIVFALCLVGVQSAFRIRWLLDQSQGRALRELVPDPAPGSLLVPLEIRSTGIRSGSPVFDAQFRSVWEYPWSAGTFVRSVYRRTDVAGGYRRGWAPRAAVAGADEDGMLYRELGPGAREGPGRRVPWSSVIPFAIDDDDSVHLVTEVLIEDGQGGARAVRVPQTQGKAARTVRLPRR